MILPIGNRILVRPIDGERKTASGLYVPLSRPGEANGNAWGEIVALPEHNDNPFLKNLAVGDRLLYKRFQADQSIGMDESTQFEVVDIEADNRPGQILAVEKAQ